MSSSSFTALVLRSLKTPDGSKNATRIVSVVAATVIALACGTNYAYSAWAPQFAIKLNLSSKEINLIGTSANLGMYGMGIPVGMLVDHKGPRPAVLLGAIALALGYIPIYRAFEAGPGSFGVVPLCLFSLLTGIGSCSAFFAAIKTSAWNWPEHRGTATAFPMAGFGLSAFFFSALASLVFPDDTSGFLLFLAIGTSAMVLVSFFFLRVVQHAPTYAPLPTQEDHAQLGSSPLHRKDSTEGRAWKESDVERGRANAELRREHDVVDHSEARVRSTTRERPGGPSQHGDDTASIMSGPRTTNFDVLRAAGDDGPESSCSHHTDIRGLALLRKTEFWQQFILLGTLTGIGLMTINNIGNDTQALWSHYDDSVSKDFIQKRQHVHVSIISLMSFSGRLTSGVSSDLIQKKLGMSRFWCVALAGLLFAVAQISAAQIENPHHLWAVSGLSGLAYGITFGVYPALVTEQFGVHGFSQNWGCLCLGAIVAANLFNLIYGSVYDHHSILHRDGHRHCPDGSKCYRAAYLVTFVASLVTVGISVWGIRTDHFIQHGTEDNRIGKKKKKKKSQDQPLSASSRGILGDDDDEDINIHGRAGGGSGGGGGEV